MCKASLEEWHRINNQICIYNTFTAKGLVPGELYKFRVSAVNGSGQGEVSVMPSPVQALDRLTSPEIEIDASFKQTHIVKNGGTVTLQISFRGKPTPLATWSKVDGELPGEAREMTEPIIATEEPAPPKRLDVIDTTNSTASLVWLKPEHDGGSRVRGYIVEFRVKGTDVWVVYGETKSLKMLVEGLSENKEYDFRVKAKNDAGISDPQATFSSVVIKEPRIEPTADLSNITNQLITCKASNTFTIDVPISGRPAPKVTWKLEEMKLKETDRVSIKTTKERATLVVKDSKRSDSGKYYLTLENAAGVKTFTVTVGIVGRPSPPTGPVEISEISSESCTLSWTEPTDDGGTEITNYIVEKRESGSASWQVVNSSVKRTTIKVTHLTKYMEYTFRVCAENKFGVSKSIESAAVVIEHPFGKHLFVYLELAEDLKKTVCLRAGGTMRLFVSVTGRPSPVVAWRKTGVELQSRGYIETTDSYTSLIVEKVNRYDSGKYTVEAENPSGKKTTIILVKVYGMPRFSHSQKPLKNESDFDCSLNSFFIQILLVLQVQSK
uniref:Titin n=1 Tax=Oryzias latipes TaxID=8090 RepID=A0A3P9HG54_ORYLA